MIRIILATLLVFSGSPALADKCDDQLKEIESQFEGLGNELKRIFSKLDIASIDRKFFSDAGDKPRLINSADEVTALDEIKRALTQAGCDIPSRLKIDKEYNCVSFSARISIPLELVLEKKFGGIMGWGEDVYKILYLFSEPQPSKRLVIKIDDGDNRYSVTNYMERVKGCDVRFTKGINFEFFDVLPNPYASNPPEPKRQLETRVLDNKNHVAN